MEPEGSMTPTPPNPDDEMQSAAPREGQELIVAVAQVYVDYWRFGAVRARDRECAKAVLAELRRRGAWLPGMPITDAMTVAALNVLEWGEQNGSAVEDWSDADVKVVRLAITAALSANARTEKPC
jgi:hypothetical protein